MVASPWIPHAPETPIDCTSCGKAFCESEEIFQVTLRFVVRTETGLTQCHVLGEDGDCAYEPTFFHVGCWEEVVEGLREAVADTPSVEDEEAALLCTFCESGVREWEHFGRAYIGELRRSPRCPDGQKAYRFVRIDSSAGSLICLPCMQRVHDEVLEIWDEVSQEGECSDCIHDRCWRQSECECDCHSED